MKKILYILLVSSLILMVTGCSEKKVLEEEPTETPVVEEPAETPEELPEAEVEEPIVELVEEPVTEEPVEAEDVSEKYAYEVSPGPISDGDIMVGQGLVVEFFNLLYNHGDENIIDEESTARMLTLIESPDRIQEFIDTGVVVLEYYEKVNVTDVTSVFSEAAEINGVDTIIYDTSISLITNGEENVQDWKTYVVKLDGALKISGYN